MLCQFCPQKLEPERKVKLAQELGLCQVAVWFQNHRARWKTKQLERDYGSSKPVTMPSSINTNLSRERMTPCSLRELKSELNGGEGKIEVKEEASLSESEEKCDLEIHGGGDAIDMDMEVQENEMIGGGATGICGDLKDGSSDSDSSAILDEDNNSPIAAAISYLKGQTLSFKLTSRTVVSNNEVGRSAKPLPHSEVASAVSSAATLEESGIRPVSSLEERSMVAFAGIPAAKFRRKVC